MDWKNHLEENTILKNKVKVKLPHLNKKTARESNCLFKDRFRTPLNWSEMFMPQNNSLFRSTSNLANLLRLKQSNINQIKMSPKLNT